MRSFLSLTAVVLVMLTASAVRAEKADPFLFLPSSGSGPFPVALWLHGYRGYSVEGYAAAPKEDLQKHADALGAAIVGFPATTDLGDDTQQWSEEPVADHAYIQFRLKGLAAEHKGKLDLAKVALFGFSQGAMVSADLATLYPESYLGAIVMSPGGVGDPHVPEKPGKLHAKQVYYCFCGADEAKGNVLLTKAYAEHLEKVLGSKVTLQLAPGVSKHTRPPEFMAKFPEWMGAILKSRG